MIMRFKRVEIQVVQDERETIMAIFKKLKFIKITDIVFMVSLFILWAPLEAYRIYYDNVIEGQIDFSSYTPKKRVIDLTICVDCLILFTLLAMVLIYIAQVFSLVRLIKFLSSRKVMRLISYILLVPLSLIYVN